MTEQNIRLCCDLIDRVAKDLNLRNGQSEQSMFILHCFLKESPNDRNRITEVPKEIYAAASLIVREKLYGEKSRTLLKDANMRKLLHSCFDGKLTKYDRAISAAQQKSIYMQKIVEGKLKFFDRSIDQELQRLVKMQDFNHNAKLYSDLTTICSSFSKELYKMSFSVDYLCREIVLASLYITFCEFKSNNTRIEIDSRAYERLADIFSRSQQKITDIVVGFMNTQTQAKL